MPQHLLRITVVATCLLASSAAWADPPGTAIDNLWKLTFVDEFDGDELDPNNWTIEAGNPENFELSPLSGGILKVKALPNDPSIASVARISSGPRIQSGHITIRARAAADAGIMSAAWWNAWPTPHPTLVHIWEDDFSDGLTDWNLILRNDGLSYREQFDLTSTDPFPGSNDLSAAYYNYEATLTETGQTIWEVDNTPVVGTEGTYIPTHLITSDFNVAIQSRIMDPNEAEPNDPDGKSFDVAWVRMWEKRDICLGGDSFIYPGGSLDGRDGGKGWAQPWSVTGGAVEVEGLGANLETATVALPTPAGDRALFTAGSTEVAVRDLAAPGVELSQDKTFYVSMLVKKDDAGEFDVAFRSSGGDARWYFGATSSESVYTGIVSSVSASNAVPVDETVLLLAKLTATNANPDTAEIAVIRAGDPLPASDADIDWLATQTGNSGVTCVDMIIEATAGSVEIDEIKIGATLADVLVPGGSPTDAESFDYADATLDGKDGGSGWGGAWLSLAVLSNDDVSLQYPTSPSQVPLSGYGDTLILTDGVAERAIADDFALASTDVYFMSFLAQKGAAGDLLVEAVRSSDGASRWKAGLRGFNEVLGGIAGLSSSADQQDYFAAGSLDYPASVALPAAGSRIAQEGVGAAELNLPADVSAYSGEKWMSFLARKDADGVFAIRAARSSDDAARWNVEVAADGTVRAEIAVGADSAPGAMPNDESVLIITKFTGAASDPGNLADMVQVAVIGAADALPANEAAIVWDVAANDHTTVTMDKLVVEASLGVVEIDQVRYGDTYASVTSTDAGLIDGDGFDYPGGTIDGQGGWDGDLVIAGEPTDSLEYPALSPPIPFASDGGRIDQDGAGSATLDDLRPAVFGHHDPPSTRWFSFLAQKDSAGSFGFSAARETDGIVRWYFDVNADGSITANVWGTPATSAAGTVPDDETVLIIARYLGSNQSGFADPNLNDRVDVLVLRDGDTLPASEAEIEGDPNDITDGLWDVTQRGHTTVIMHELVVDVFAGNVQLDELRFGNTYESVTSSNSNLFKQDSFDYATGPIDGGVLGSDVWYGDLNIEAGPGSFANETVFVLSMFEAAGGPEQNSDTVYVKTFRSAGEVPATPFGLSDWDVIVPGQSDVTIDKIRISSTGGAPIYLDELKVGTTYASVTGFELPGDCVTVDGLLDWTDYANCFDPCLKAGGPDVIVDGCELTDMDGDLDVDLADLAKFADLFEEPL